MQLIQKRGRVKSPLLTLCRTTYSTVRPQTFKKEQDFQRLQSNLLLTIAGQILVGKFIAGRNRCSI